MTQLILEISLSGSSSYNPKGFSDSYAWPGSCEERTSFYMGCISRKLCRFLLMFSTGFTSLIVLLLFLYQSPSSSLCIVFDSISSSIDEVFLVNPSAVVFVFGDFKIRHKDWPTCSGGTDRPGELCYNFSVSKRPYSDG